MAPNLFSLFKTYFLYTGVLYLYVYALHVCSAYIGQKGALHSLGLGLQKAVGCTVSTEDPTWTFHKSSQCAQSESSLQPCIYFLSTFTCNAVIQGWTLIRFEHVCDTENI